METATAVLWLGHLTTGSAPRTAAAPQIELPMEVIIVVSESILSIFPMAIPKSIVRAITIISTTIAGRPTSITSVRVSLNP